MKRSIVLTSLLATSLIVSLTQIPEAQAEEYTAATTGISAPSESLESSGTPSVEIVDVGAPVHQMDADLNVTATVSNPTAGALVITESTLSAQSWTPNSRARLFSFMRGEDAYLTTEEVLSDDVTVPAGASTTLSFHVTAEDLNWENTSTQWGPRGLEVDVTLQDQTVLTDRSLVVLAPNYDVDPMPATVVVPLTATAQELADEPELSTILTSIYGTSSTSSPTTSSTEPVLESQAATDRITHELKALTTQGVTAVIDPSILTNDDVKIAANTFTGTSGTELAITPLYDADIQSLIATGHKQLAQDSLAQGARTAADSGVAVTTNLALLTPNTDQQTVSALASMGVSGVVVAGNEVPATGYRYYTASGRFDLPLDSSSSISALATDSAMSAALAGVLVDDDETAATSETTQNLSALDSRQTVLALSAITYRERPSDSRATVLALDRNGLAAYGMSTLATATSDDALDISNLQGTISALMSAPWVEASTASKILTLTPAADERDALKETVSATGALTNEELTSIEDATSAISLVAGLSATPRTITDPANTIASQLYSTVWRSSERARLSRIQSLLDTANYFTSSLHVMRSSTIRVVSQQTELPVHVTSTLPFDVGVTLKLDSRDTRLEADKIVAVTVPARSSARVMVPIEAKGSGNIKVEAKILTPNGTQIGSAQDIEIRVRADWENIGTLIVAILIALVLVVGIIRSLKRGRRGSPIEPEKFKALRQSRAAVAPSSSADV